MKQLNLFLAFFRVGMLGYGGGPASIPLVHKEVVEKYKWMDDEEFGDVLALANTLPGPIATKMAGYIGYRVAGFLGLANALLASIIPTILLMILLLTSLSAYKDQPWVQGMTKAVVPVVGVMLAVLTWQFFQNSQKGMGWKGSLAMVAFSFIIMEVIGIHPGILIALLLGWALFGPEKKEEKKSEKQVVVPERKTV
ncbi:MAG TPA: chromate transporter [Bacillus bacterium]|nr:chromate transporter [Bacillus sp. (in: firmicutes)]